MSNNNSLGYAQPQQGGVGAGGAGWSGGAQPRSPMMPNGPMAPIQPQYPGGANAQMGTAYAQRGPSMLPPGFQRPPSYAPGTPGVGGFMPGMPGVPGYAPPPMRQQPELSAAPYMPQPGIRPPTLNRDGTPYVQQPGMPGDNGDPVMHNLPQGMPYGYAQMGLLGGWPR